MSREFWGFTLGLDTRALVLTCGARPAVIGHELVHAIPALLYRGITQEA